MVWHTMPDHLRLRLRWSVIQCQTICGSDCDQRAPAPAPPLACVQTASFHIYFYVGHTAGGYPTGTHRLAYYPARLGCQGAAHEAERAGRGLPGLPSACDMSAAAMPCGLRDRLGSRTPDEHLHPLCLQETGLGGRLAGLRVRIGVPGGRRAEEHGVERRPQVRVVAAAGGGGGCAGVI